VGVGTPTTNLVIHHGIADILDQASKLIHIIGAVQEPCNFASLLQWDEVLKNVVQFASKLNTLNRV